MSDPAPRQYPRFQISPERNDWSFPWYIWDRSVHYPGKLISRHRHKTTAEAKLRKTIKAALARGEEVWIDG